MENKKTSEEVLENRLTDMEKRILELEDKTKFNLKDIKINPAGYLKLYTKH